MDYLGTTDYLTSPVSGKVEAWTHYNEWGLITHNAVLKCGQRELDLVKRYATHDYDSVLELYYAKARFYDAHDRRFTAVDPILDPSGYDLREYVQNPVQLVQYLYVGNQPLDYIDLLGLCFFDKDGNWSHDNWESTGNHQIKSDPKNKVLRQGSCGYEVEELQKLLVKYGYLTSYAEVDGSFGPRTLQAVKEFQRRNNLEVDGSVGPKTWEAFFKSNVDKASGMPKIDSTVNTVELPQNSVDNQILLLKPNDVLMAQMKLQMIGYYQGPINGIFDTNTQLAVKELQRFYTDVPDTGVLDNATLWKIDTVLFTRQQLDTAPPKSTLEQKDYYDELSCIEFNTKIYKGWDAFWKIVDFATNAGISIWSAKNMIAAVATVGAATAGIGGVTAGLAMAPKLVKTVADAGVYGSLAVSAAALWYFDGGFTVSEAKPTSVLGIVIYVEGYPVLGKLPQ